MAATTTLYETISQTINMQRTQVAEDMLASYYSAQPDLLTRYGPDGRTRHLQEINCHLVYLTQAIAVSTPELYIDFVTWAKVLLAKRDEPSTDLLVNLAHLRDALRKHLPDKLQPPVMQLVEAGIEQCTIMTPDPPSHLSAEVPHAELARDYLDALLAADRTTASRLIFDAIHAGVSVRDLYVHVFQRTQHEIGRLWQLNQVSVAQEHYCTAATQLIMSQLYPYIFASKKNGRTIVAACVARDLHELGIRMIADFFEMDGWNTIYLGADTPIASLITMLVDQKADILALSATMPYHIQAVVDVIAALRASDARDVKVLVGGHPFNRAPDLWKKIGADGFAADADTALVVANDLLHT